MQIETQESRMKGMVVKHWKRLHREVAESLSLDKVESQEDTVLSNLLQVTALSRGVGQMVSRGALQPQLFCDFVTR